VAATRDGGDVDRQLLQRGRWVGKGWCLRLRRGVNTWISGEAGALRSAETGQSNKETHAGGRRGRPRRKDNGLGELDGSHCGSGHAC
jgi:hypothetical protein